MITLKKLKWSNCFSYGPDNELQLDDNTVTQIIGTNGMGKSSIPLIIEEALYNKNSKGIKKADIPNRYINDGYDIELEFEKSGKEYLIRINRKNNIKVALLEDGEDISSHTATNTYKSIQEILGIDFKTFSQLVYQNTNASLQFLTATDTNRKKFLIDLLRLEEYVQLFEIFKEASRESSNKMIEVSSEITNIEKWLSNNKLEATNILPLLNLEIDTDEDEKIFRSLSIELKNISEKNKKILRNNQYREMLSKININELQSLPPVEKLSYDKFQNIIGQVEGAKRASDKMLQKLEQLEDKCPTCEQDIDAEFKDQLIQAEKKTLGFLALQKKENEQIIEKIKKDNAEFTRREKLQKEWEDLFRNIDNTLPSNILDADELQEKLDEVTIKLKTAKAKLADIALQNEEITKRNTRIEIIEAQTDGFLKKLAAAQEVLNEQR